MNGEELRAALMTTLTRAHLHEKHDHPVVDCPDHWYRSRAALAAPSTPEPSGSALGVLAGSKLTVAEHAEWAAPSTEPALDAPAIPELDCECGACVYLRRKQAEHYAARLAESQP